MTTKEIIETKYLPFLRETGNVTATPEVTLSDGKLVTGYDPPLLVKWYGTSGSRLDQPADLIASDILANDGGIDIKMDAWRTEVIGTVGGKQGGPHWNAWLDSAKPPSPVVDQSPLGPRWPAEYVAQFNVNQSRAYYAVVGAAREGAIYTDPSGKRYLCIRTNPFALWWVGL